MRWTWLLLTVALAGCLGGSESTSLEPPRLDLEISWTPEVPLTGQDVTFSVSAQSPVSGDTLEKVVWKIGETVIEASRPTHVFGDEGTFPVIVQVTSSQTGLNQAESEISVLLSAQDIQDPAPAAPEPEAPAPVAEAGAPLEIVIEQDANVVAFSYVWDQEPELVAWDFGDGETSNDHTPVHTYGAEGTYAISLRATGDDGIEEVTSTVAVDEVPSDFVPHVIVAIPDSGANPYHEAFYRPKLNMHPCTYVEDFPCDVPELPLSVGQGLSYGDALAQDRPLWEAMKPGTFYWIPKTAFVAFGCESDHDGLCGLDDASTHGTGTTGSVISEEPDALLAFKEGGSAIGMFGSGDIPVDIFSVSWGWVLPEVGLSFPYPLCGDNAPLYVKSAGNEPGISTMTDCWTSHSKVMSVGGAYAQDNSQYAASGKEPDFVSYYCRPAPRAGAAEGETNWCGTSFSAPTAAGAIAKVVLAIREASGYTGSLDGDMVDPIAGVDVATLREALRMTASYDPEPRYSNTNLLSVPLNPAAPCLQWSWGFLDAGVVDATIAHLSGGEQGSKSAWCDAYMRAIEASKQAAHG